MDPDANLNIWIDSQGGTRDVNMLLNAIISTLRLLGTNSKGIYAVNFYNKEGTVINQTSTYQIIDFVSGINEVYMQVLTIEDNVLKQILQVFENITHYAKEDIFALTVMIGCFWLVLCKGLLWGPAVIFLIYNGSGLLPFLVVAFIIDLIINKILSTTKSKKNYKKGPDETDAVRVYRYEDLF